MSQKIIFLDIDGTLVNDFGVVPDTAKYAVQKARENGHLVFLCTGRSKIVIFPDIIEMGFDGMIGSAGGYIEMGETVLFHEKIQLQNIQHVVDFFGHHQIEFFLESTTGMYSSTNGKKYFQLILDKLLADKPDFKVQIEKGFRPFYDLLIEGQDLIRDDINKVSFLSSEIPFDMIKKEFEATFTVIPNTVSLMGQNSGELSLPGIHKASAIEKIIQHLGIEKENTYAYGDSWNDLEMLEYVQYGIAMGNAHEEIKKVANDITDRHDDDGIYNSFKKYGLI